MKRLLVNKIKNRIRRYLNQRHRYDYSPENNGWKKYGNSPFFGDKKTGTVYDPYAVFVDGKFSIYASFRKNGAIGKIDSWDGIHWNEPIVVLEGISDTWENIVNRACVLFANNKWHMWYCGLQNEVSQIGYAYSNDGIHFIRCSENPIISAKESFEGVSVMNPSVLWDSQRKLYRMWYSAGDNYEPDVICYAESSDGICWNKYKEPVLKPNLQHEWEKYKIGGCHVTELSENELLMFYIGYQNLDVARICYAKSIDGKKWERSDNNLIISPTKGSWDSDAVYKPTVIMNDKMIYLWYNGRKKYDEYLGCVIKKVEI